MRSVVPVAVIVLLLVIPGDITGFDFGDIIHFPPKALKECPTFKYRHVAIYVGDVPIKGKNQGEDIFERLRDDPSCVFSRLNMSHGPTVYHDLDTYKDKNGKVYTKGSVAEMTQRILELHANCGKYNALTNNCEHLANYVRYGVKVAMQISLSGEGLCINEKSVNRKHMLKHLKEKQNEAPGHRRNSG